VRIHPLLTTLMFSVFLFGCDHRDSDDYGNIDNLISIHAGHIAVHAQGQGDADITAAGELSIAGKSIAITATQSELFKRYYASALAMRDHGIAAGEAGVATANKAITSVASNLASGNPEKIDAEVNASAAKVKAQADKVCDDLGQIRSIQETLAAQLPAFRPYALINASEANDCRHGRRA
jgi:hypothetical protein